MEEMLHHSKAVSRATENTFVIGDMPFISYQASVEKAVQNAGRFVKEANLEAVKVEGKVRNQQNKSKKSSKLEYQ